MSIRKIDDDIRNRYPYPLSGTFHRAYYDTRDITLIHDYLFDLFEATLKYLTSCVLAQYIQDGAPDAAINQSLLNIQRPSLGHWQGWLRDIVKYYQKQKQPLLMPEIGEVYDRKSSGDMYRAFTQMRAMMTEQMAFKGDGRNYQQITTQQFFDLLGQYRNKRAHGAQLNVYDRKQVVEWLLPAMRELFVALEFTARYRLVFINEVKLAGTRREMSYEHFITDLSGYRPSIVNDPFMVSAPSGRPEELYVCARDQDFAPMLSLHPFLIYRFCKECSTEQAFVLNQSREETLSYLSYQCSHQFSLTEYIDDLQTILGTLAGGVPSLLPPPESIAPADRERREQRDQQRESEQQRREAEDRQVVQTERQLADQQEMLSQRLLAEQLAEERRKLEEERQRIAQELDRLHREQEERERQRQEQDQAERQKEAQRRITEDALSQTIVCPNCRRVNPAGKKFCSNCGIALVAGVAPPAQRPAQPPAPQWQSPAYQPQPPGYQPGYYNAPGYQQPPAQPYTQPAWNQPAPRQQPGVQPQPAAPAQPPAQNSPAAAGETKTCPRCRRQNPAARKFCTSCGLPLAAVPLDPGSAATPPTAGRPSGTAPLPSLASAEQPAAEKICPRCGRRNPAARKFCSSCGLSLVDVQVVAAAASGQGSTARPETPSPQGGQGGLSAPPAGDAPADELLAGLSSEPGAPPAGGDDPGLVVPRSAETRAAGDVATGDREVPAADAREQGRG